MQSIVTRYHGPTSTKAAYMTARASGYSKDYPGLKIRLAYHHELNIEENHKQAVYQLIQKLDWRGHWIKGDINTWGSVWVRATAQPSDSIIYS